MISFSGAHYPKEVILYAVFFYVRYGVSNRDLEEILGERGIKVDHSTLNHWVIRYSLMIAEAAMKNKRPAANYWRVDGTYIKVKGQWVYYYRAVDKHGDTLDFLLAEHRDEDAATLFFKQAIDNNGLPNRCLSQIRILECRYLKLWCRQVVSTASANAKKPILKKRRGCSELP